MAARASGAGGDVEGDIPLPAMRQDGMATGSITPDVTARVVPSPSPVPLEAVKLMVPEGAPYLPAPVSPSPAKPDTPPTAAALPSATSAVPPAAIEMPAPLSMPAVRPFSQHVMAAQTRPSFSSDIPVGGPDMEPISKKVGHELDRVKHSNV